VFDPSDWQFSKLYIWDYHLRPRLYAGLTVTVQNAIRNHTSWWYLPSVNSQSAAGATACTCNVGYTGADGTPCFACDANTFKTFIGLAACEVCPSKSVSVPGSTDRTDCRCNSGYVGPNGGPCTACPENTFKSVVGSSACLSCLNSNSTAGSTECVCGVGWMGWPFPVNVALTCGASYNGQCSSDVT